MFFFFLAWPIIHVGVTMIHILALDDHATTNEGQSQIEQLSLFSLLPPHVLIALQ
jgi:hypothetical protein